MIRGIDVSKHQGVIDWPTVAQADVHFAILRASFGTDYIDPFFIPNLTKAREVGIDIGAFHYCYAKNVDEARAEAQHFLSVIEGYVYEYPICLDMEDKAQDGIGVEALTDMIIAFMEIIENAGYFAALYMSESWFKSRVNLDRLKKYTLWNAHWGVDKPGIDCGIWQFWDHGKVSGINTDVDLNWSYNDYPTIIKNAGLNGFTKPQPPQPEEPPAPVDPNLKLIEDLKLQLSQKDDKIKGLTEQVDALTQGNALLEGQLNAVIKDRDEYKAKIDNINTAINIVKNLFK